MKERLCWNPQAELIPEKSMRRLRLKKLKCMLKYVYENSRFYKRKFDDAGVHPRDIKSFDNFAKKVPFTTKEDLRAIQSRNPPLGDNICVPYGRVRWIVASTGTTGSPTYTGVTQHDWETWMESLKRGFWLQGFRPGDVFLHAFALGPWISGIAYTQGAREMGMTVVPVGVPTPATRMLTLARACHANVMVCTPSYAEHLAERVREILKIDPRNFGLRKLGCGGEPGVGISSIRKRIENLWNCDCHDRMGTPEQMPGNRAECYMKNGMHLVTPDFIYDEIVDPDTKEIIEPEESAEGALVYTALETECNPLIRFYVNDCVRVRTLDCECGYPGYTLTVVSRFDAMLKVKGVKVWPSAIKDILSELVPKVTGEFRIVLEERPIAFAVRGPIKLRVEYGKNMSREELQILREEIVSRIKSSLYFTPDEIQFVPPKTLLRSEFKAKYIEIHTGTL